MFSNDNTNMLTVLSAELAYSDAELHFSCLKGGHIVTEHIV